MPAVEMGAYTSAQSVQINEDLGYKYPMKLNLRPDSELHEKIVGRLLRRIRVASENLEGRRRSWRDIDRTLTAYIPLSDIEKRRKCKDGQAPVSIVFPHSYAILETLTSFMDGVFLKQPIFHYKGNSPEDTAGAILLEKVIEAHCQRFKVGLSLHTAFKDGLAYGIGAVFPMWKQKFGWRTQTVLDEVGQPTKESQPTLLFEGNAIENVDPYQLLLDPNYGVQAVQDSEFVGFVRRTNYYNLIEDDDNGSVFNVRYLRSGGNQTSQFFFSQRDDGPQIKTVGDTSVLKPIDVIYMYIKIIPKEWGIGKSESVEKWLFALAGDKILIQAQPLDLDHDMFPIAICAPTFDGYSSAPLSRLELLDGMQELLNWLFNSHITNVRKTINDMIIYDPFVLNTSDLTDPKPGKLVRVRRAAWGKDIRGSIQQLQVNDVTRQNVSDAQLTMQLMDKVSGADAAMMGSLREGGPERLSAAEFNGTQNQAFGRLKSMTSIVEQQLIQDIGYMFAMHTQQLMAEDTFVSTVGEWQSLLLNMYGERVYNDRMRVTPQDLNIDFDVSLNGNGPDSQTEAQFWIQMFDIITRNPELYQIIDVGKVFRFVASQLGASNVDNFLRPEVQQMLIAQPMTAPTEQVMQEAQAGNMIPQEEIANALG